MRTVWVSMSVALTVATAAGRSLASAAGRSLASSPPSASAVRPLMAPPASARSPGASARDGGATLAAPSAAVATAGAPSAAVATAGAPPAAGAPGASSSRAALTDVSPSKPGTATNTELSADDRTKPAEHPGRSTVLAAPTRADAGPQAGAASAGSVEVTAPRGSAAAEPSDSPYLVEERPKASTGTPKAAAKPAKPSKVNANAKPNAKVDPARRAIAGAPTASEVARGAESPELALLRAADRELFAPASPPIGTPWPSDLPAPMPIDPNRPVVHATGVPPTRALVDAPSTDAPRDLAWLRALTMPDVPVRWDARVLRYLDYYRSEPRGKQLAQAWLKKSGRYGHAMRRALREQGLPEDLVWVSLVESGFDPTIRSAAGAAGLWQLMPDGARIYGLVVDRWIDERLDPERATEAAARYLSDLHRRFGAWELALAAYNMGYGGLLAAIRKYNTNDYWELCRFESGVPFETAVYVPKIIAMSVVARNFRAFNLDAAQVDPPITFDQVAVPGGVALRAIAAAAGVETPVIEALNPQLRAGRTPPDGATVGRLSWTVRVPVGKGAAVTQAVARQGASAAESRRYRTRLGDSVDAIARRMAVSRARLVELNAIRSDEVVRPGTVLLLPSRQDGDGEPALAAVVAARQGEKTPVVVPEQPFRVAGRRRVFYRAVTGDSLREIAAAFAVAADDLCRWNALDPAARLHDGMTLQVFAPPHAELDRVVHLTDDDVHCMTVGSDEFFSYFEALRGRQRTAIQVQEGDTWEKIGKRYKLTLGQLERINRRWHTEKLTVGETLIVYAPVGRPVVHEAETPSRGPSELPPMVAPNPEDLPSLESFVDPAAALPGRSHARLR